MSDSLRDQLLKAGLVTSEQVREAEQSKGRRTQKPRNKPGRGKKPRADASKRAQRQEPARSAASQPTPAPEPAQAKRPVEGRARSRIDRRLKTLLDEVAVNDTKADIAHHFTRGSKIKHVYVTKAQQRQLADGEIAIAVFHGRNFIVSWSDARRLSEIDPDLFVFRHDPDAPDPEAEHPVPDDLDW